MNQKFKTVSVSAQDGIVMIEKARVSLISQASTGAVYEYNTADLASLVKPGFTSIREKHTCHVSRRQAKLGSSREHSLVQFAYARLTT